MLANEIDAHEFTQRRIGTRLSLWDPGTFGAAEATVHFVDGTDVVDEASSAFYINGRDVPLADFLKVTGLTKL